MIGCAKEKISTLTRAIEYLELHARNITFVEPTKYLVRINSKNHLDEAVCGKKYPCVGDVP